MTIQQWYYALYSLQGKQQYGLLYCKQYGDMCVTTCLSLWGYIEVIWVHCSCSQCSSPDYTPQLWCSLWYPFVISMYVMYAQKIYLWSCLVDLNHQLKSPPITMSIYVYTYIHTYAHMSCCIILVVSGALGVTSVPSWEVITHDGSEETDTEHWSIIRSRSTESIEVTFWSPPSSGQ